MKKTFLPVEEIIRACNESIELKKKLMEDLSEDISSAAGRVADAFLEGKKLLICGNGGSAADAQHIAAEFVGRFRKERKPMAAIALTTDTSVLTCLANDYNYNRVFQRQVEALGNEGDVLLAISTSGNSVNIVEAVRSAIERKIYTIGMLGKDGGILKNIVDLPILVESQNTPRIQETHIFIGHIICELVENALFQ